MMTLRELMATFPTDDACKEYLFNRRWPDGAPRCPRCGKSETVYNINQPWKWECSNKECRKGHAYRFSITAGTIFEETKKPLLTWFEVLWQMLNSKKGVSAKQIQRQIGCGSYETAWYMCMRLRGAMHDPDFRQLMGIVEVDETAIGGKDKNRHWDKKQHITGMSGKTTVVGAISRKGSVVCQVIEKTDATTLSRFVRKAVSDKVDLVATDEHLGYDKLSAIGYSHGAVTHSTGEYVRGQVHTNNIESFWRSLLKRGIMGTYHNVSAKYLSLYLAEFQFRHNNRRESDIFGKAIEGA